MTIYAIASFINFVGALSFGVFLLAYNYRSDLHRRLALTNFTIAFWAFGFWQWQMADGASLALFWTRFLTIGSIFIPATFILWVTTFIHEIKKYRVVLLGVCLSTFIFSLLTLTPLMVNGVRPELSFPYWPIAGSAYIFFLIFHFFGLMVWGFVLLSRYSKVATGVERDRLRFVLGGMIVGFISGLTNFPLWYGIPIPPIGNFLIIVYPLSLTYAMVRYRFLDVRFALRAMTVRVIKVFLLVLLFTLLVFGYSAYFNEPFNLPGYLFFAFIAAILIVVGNEYVDRSVGQVVNKALFEKSGDRTNEYRKLQALLVSSLDLDTALNAVRHTLKETLGVNRVSFFIHLDRQHRHLVVKGDQVPGVVYDNTGFSDLLKSFSDIVILDELKAQLHTRIHSDLSQKQTQMLIREMGALKAALIVPLPRKDGIVDFFVTGPKANQESFSVQDVQDLHVLRFQLSLVLENMLLYAGEKEFSSRLKDEVERATSNLRRAYDQLKTVDKMKDYIIDISSHELRTPATIVKSYLWMVLQGKRGKITASQKDAINRAYQSNDRLIHLISDMLDVSRIEGGRLELRLTQFEITKVVQKIIDELTLKAREKSLSLKLEVPDYFWSKMVGDKEKIEEVLINLISNAISYTIKGGVTVSLEDAGEFVIIHVKDTGVGIPEKEMPKLFTKFYRTEQALVEVPTAGGTGLGLFITRSLVRLMGGKIWVKSAPDQGSTFSVMLPKMQNEQEEKTHESDN